MKNLYAPWRSAYSNGTLAGKPKECPFCVKPKENQDEKNFILKKGKQCYIVMNLYPYNAGHMMVIPNRHVAKLNDLNQDELFELIKFTAEAQKAVEVALGAQGVNVGMNIGRPAGAGIPDHIHMHIVPRWDGDTNFLPVISEVKQISFDMNEFYQKLKNVL